MAALFPTASYPTAAPDALAVSGSGTTYFQSIAGSSTFTSGVMKSTYKYPASTIVYSSTINKLTTKTFTSITNATGAPNPSTGLEQAVEGSITPESALTIAAKFARSYGSSIPLSGAFAKTIQKLLFGSISLAGGVYKGMYLLLQGSMSIFGAVSGFKFTPTVSGFINRGMRFMRKFIGRR